MIFVSIGLFGFSLAGLKQTFAMALMLHAFLFFVDKKYLWSMLFIALTYYTHPACLIFAQNYTKKRKKANFSQKNTNFAPKF